MHEIMGFLWPLMAASAEGMIFLWIIVILVIIGRGKLLPSEKHIVIERNGKYKMDLAPGLNLAQAFIEALAKQISLHEESTRNDAELNFRVRDKNISSTKQPFYLLGISMKNGFLCFEAIAAPLNSKPSEAVPFKLGNHEATANHLESEIYAVAKLWVIDLERI
jgi:hypothetical protein